MAEDAKTPSLLQRAIAKGKPKGPQCTFKGLLPNPEIQELLDNTGRDEQDRPRGIGLNYSVAAETLEEAGINVKADTISRHIRGKCSCVAS